MKQKLKILNMQWGWITPGTGNRNKQEQWDEHIRFLAENREPACRNLLVTHCGWWIDCDVSKSVRELTRGNAEPNRSLSPLSRKALGRFTQYIQEGRVEFVVYPYAACVAEATSGEGLLRSFRLSRDIAAEHFGATPRVFLNHDAVYRLEWGTVQMPQIAGILGIRTTLGTSDQSVIAPDGTTIRIIGENPMQEILNLGKGPRETIFYVNELAPSIRMFDNLSELREEFPAVANLEFVGITLGEYLKSVPVDETVKSTEKGTKNWYGGTIDSLLQEQNVKSAELRLPAIEALSVLAGRSHEIQPEILDLWKRSFILMDNHTLWQCHDYKAHYLPQSGLLLANAVELEESLLRGGGTGQSNDIITFNPLPWERDMVVEHGGKSYQFSNVPGWGCGQLRICAAATASNDIDPYSLNNGQVTYKLNRCGEIIGYSNEDGDTTFDGLGQLVRIHEQADETETTLRTGAFLRGFAGSATLTAEIDLGRSPISHVFFEALDIVGDAFLLEAERFDRNNASIGIEKIPLHSLHWGGLGLPRHKMNISPRKLHTYSARKLKITLRMLAEGKLKVGPAKCWWGEDNQYIKVNEWSVNKHYQNGYSHPEKAEAKVLESNSLIKKVSFSGQLPDVNYQLVALLRKHSRFLEYCLKLDFPLPTPLGLSSPPFSKEDGSMLGAQCERPYVPGLAILAPLPGPAQYYSDKPYYICDAFQKAAQTWHTDRENWWLGMSTFIGMYMAGAHYRDGQLGFLTRGLKHFFRWQHEGHEILGLSLGASLIHQATQGHSAPKDSPCYEIIKRTNHDPYFATPFLYAHGEYTFHYAFLPEKPGRKARLSVWKNSREFALPPVAVKGSGKNICSTGVTCSPPQVIMTALEQDGDTVTIRLVNMKAGKCKATVTLPFRVQSAAMTFGDEPIEVKGSTLTVILKSHAIREIKVQLAQGKS